MVSAHQLFLEIAQLEIYRRIEIHSSAARSFYLKMRIWMKYEIELRHKLFKVIWERFIGGQFYFGIKSMNGMRWSLF